MPATTILHMNKRARKSIVPKRPQMVPAPSTDATIDRTVCHLCGYSGRTSLISIEKSGYNFLRYLPPAPGALPVDIETSHVRACHLCALLLDKQRELNHTTHNFFFKGFFRSSGSCLANITLPPKIVTITSDKKEQLPESLPSFSVTSTSSSNSSSINVDTPTRSIPPPLLKPSNSSMMNVSRDQRTFDELSLLDSYITSIRSRFLSEYSSIIASQKRNPYDACHLCLSIKPHGTLYTIFKSQYEFLPSAQVDVCTLCYYNLLDQYKQQQKATYRRPRAQCFLCRSRISFIDWEVKLLEIEHFPFLLTLHNEKYRDEQLYDNQRLALACDQCFFRLLFQYVDQQRRHVPIQQRTYSWQCTYSHENELFLDSNHRYYTSVSSE